MTSGYILGIGLAATRFGKSLHNGGACIVDTASVVGAIAEERLVRIKRAGGYAHAVESLFRETGICESQLRAVVASSCCEPVRSRLELPHFSGVPVLYCDHHISHALAAFCTSPFEQCVVLVLDGGGNSIGPVLEERWWTLPRQQQTYYIANNLAVTQVGEDCAGAGEAGFGEIFRAFCYFLGWHSSRYSGNVMALAAHGNSKALEGARLFTFDDRGKLLSPIVNDPHNPIQMAVEILKSRGIYGVGPRCPGRPLDDLHKHVAAWVQSEFESALCCIVDRLVSETGIDNVCLGGGVAYNCKAIGALRLRSAARNIYVGLSSGDDGQCLGNALFGRWKMEGCVPRTGRLSPYLGPRHRMDIEHVREALGTEAVNHQLTVRRSGLAKCVAKLLALGCIVGWFRGRSEFGARALGNRSILTTPSLVQAKERLNQLKGREAFMPFGPSVLESEMQRYFGRSLDIPYMSEVLYAPKGVREEIVGVLNADGGARVHTVSGNSNATYYELISTFYRLTGIGMILNTSFNGPREPIVETVQDAVRCYLALGLDAMVVGNVLVLSKHLRERVHETVGMCVDVGVGTEDMNKEEFFDVSVQDIAEKLSEVRRRDILMPRERFLLDQEYYSWIRERRKVTTIRFRRGSLEYPVTPNMPLYVTRDFSGSTKSDPETSLHVEKLKVKRFGDLNTEDALRDGFASVDELRAVLRAIYGTIFPEERVTIYHVVL